MLPHLTSAAAALSESSDTRPRVLVIDDDPLFRRLLAGMLQHDYAVVAAADGKEGFDQALEAPPDIAIVDIQMPNWNGLHTLQAFREHETLQRVSLLVLTSDASRETVLAAIHGGAEDYVSKASLSRVELLDKLSRARQRRHNTVSPAADSAPPRVALTTAVRDELAERLQDVIDAWE